MTDQAQDDQGAAVLEGDDDELDAFLDEVEVDGDEDDEEEDDDDEIVEPPPRKVMRRRRRRAPAVSPLESLPEEETVPVLSENPTWGNGASPLEMLSPNNSAYLQVERVEAYGPEQGFADGSDYIGPMGQVVHQAGFQQVIRRRWGGGKYVVRGHVGGKLIERPLAFGKIPSKPPEPEEGEVDQTMTQYPPQGGYPPAAGYPQDPYGGPWPMSYPPYDSYGYGYPAGGGYPGYPPHPGQQANPAAAAAQMFQQPTTGTSEQEKLLREQLELARESQRQAEAQAQIAEVKRESESREAAHRSEMQQVMAKLEALQGSNNNDAMTEMLKAQFAQQQQRADAEVQRRREQEERDRQDRKERLDREERERKEDAKREEQARKEEREKWERERQERLDREERDRKERLERQDREDKARREETKSRETHFNTMIQMLTSGQMKPNDMINMLGNLKTLSGPEESLGDRLSGMVNTMAVLKEIASDNSGEKSQIEKAQDLIQTVGEVATPLARELGFGQQQQQAQPMPGAVPGQLYYDPHGRLVNHLGQLVDQYGNPIQQLTQQQQQRPAGAISLNDQAGVTPQQAQAYQQTAQTASEVSGEQWGKILQFVVKAYGQDPHETAQHLLTTISAIDALPALEKLGTATVGTIRGEIRLLKMSGRITSDHYKVMADAFLEICTKDEAWTGQVLGYLSQFYQSMQQAAAHQQQQQAAAPAAPAPAPAPTAPKIVQPTVPQAEPAQPPQQEAQVIQPQVLPAAPQQVIQQPPIQTPPPQ